MIVDHQFTYQVTQINLLAENVSQIFLHPHHPNDSLSYEAGQYVDVIYEANCSPLSIACAPKENKILEFHLFHSAKNIKAQELLQQAQKQKTWQLSGPFGVCTASRLLLDTPIIFIAHGTGFAPIKAVIEALAQSKSPKLFLYWMVRDLSQLYLTNLLDEWTNKLDFHYKPILMPNRQTDNEFMHVILQKHPDFSDYQVYTSGPRSLIVSVYSQLAHRGLKQTCFFSDVYDPGELIP